LNKNAEDRYQSAFGLKRDLEKCLWQLETKEKIDEFILGLNDYSGKLQIPQKLYGRERETALLLGAFVRVCEGPSEFWLVSGYSGVGKSALIHELHRPITEQRGYFIEGKFDQFQKSVPYFAWIQAFKVWVNMVLSESAERLHFWRNKILKAVGTNGKVLTDLLPSLELVIGKQPEVAELGATEAQNRLAFVFQNFINTISKKDHPLVIFIDDWQWADTASLNLLKIIMGNYEQDYTLIIGAYRNNEVGETHPFMMTLEEIRKDEVKIQDIELSNLSSENLYELVTDTLRPANIDVNGLSELVHHKTQGNAFFVNQMLRSLYEEDMLRFDFNACRWTWEMEHINALAITDNVVDLMANKVQKLPQFTQEVLKLAACIGSQFNMAVLSPIYEESFETVPREAFRNLEPALLEGMLIPLRDEFKFSHDRIQQAVYAMLSDTERQAIHLHIARILIDRTPIDKRAEFLFDIVNHWNLGIEVLQSEEDKQTLAHLNLEAAVKAKDSSAYQPAFEYIQIALSLLPEQPWSATYDFTLEAYNQALQIAFLKGDLSLSKQYIDVVLDKGKQVLDKMPAYETIMQYHIALGEQHKAIEAGLEVVSLLNVPLADAPLAHLNPDELYALPTIQDEEKKAAMEIMDSIITPAWSSDADLFRQITYTMVNLSVAYGNCASSCVGYAFYGGILCSSVGDIETGYRFGRLAINLLDTYDARFFKAKVENIYLSSVMHWKEPARALRKRFFDAVQIGLETGEVEFACYNVVEACHYHFLMGIALDNLTQKFAKDRILVEQLKQEFHENYLAAWQQMILNLVEETPNPTQLVGEFFDETQKIDSFIHDQQRTLAFITYQAKTILAYLFRDTAQACQFAQLAEQYKDGVTGMMNLPVHNFYFSLAMIAHFPKANAEEKRAFLLQIDHNQQQLKVWAKSAPANYQHKYDLVQAETYRLAGQYNKAMDLYDIAIEGARVYQYLPEEALGNELAAQFYFDLGKEKIGKAYLQDAFHRYQLWGAEQKLIELEHRFERYLRGRNILQNLPSTVQTTIATTASGNTGNSLDMATIVKASQTLSGEVKLDNLLRKMMKIVIENAGAEKGLFILPKAGNWVVEAEYSMHQTEVEALQSIPIEKVNGLSDTPKLSSEVVYYVVRTRETLVLNDASNERSIIGAMYVEKCQPKSVLCMPLLYQGKLSGILYLENNLTTDAFTPDRQEVLEILSTQITISVENALLYHNLEEKVRERTAEVIEQKEIIEKKTQDIVSSINYAKRIQDASLPRMDKIKSILPEIFIYFKPRDIVSGDFYWCTKTEPVPIYDEVSDFESNQKVLIGFEPEKIVITAVDCTGHGVPGAFMSLIGNNLLGEIVESKGITSPELILKELHKGVRNALQQAESENKDGMDMALCVIDQKNKVLEYAGAKNQLVYIQNGKLTEIKADKLPIGGAQKEKERTFTKHSVSFQIPTTFYIFSDGYQDQFGGEDERKFMIKYLKEMFLDICEKPMDEQRDIIAQTHHDWMHFYSHEPQKQIDDVLVIGFRLG
jgi:predicted ATPase/GAF domain-containing protein